MKLGEKIYKLRNQHKMSQEDLAQKLNVSRQSISKWENNTSVPELDKLIQLSDVFQITLDELVKGENIPNKTIQSTSDMECHKNGIIGNEEETTEDAKAQVTKEIPGMQRNSQEEYAAQFQRNTLGSMSNQKIIGFILLAVGLLSLILAFVFDGGLVIVGGYLILCSILCLLVKKYAGLVIGWLTFILAMLLMTPFTGVRMFAVLFPSYWNAGVTMNHLVGVAMWIIFALLLYFTYQIILKTRR